MARAIGAVAIAVLVAGCGGFVASPETATLSPAPVPTTTAHSTESVETVVAPRGSPVADHVRILGANSYRFRQLVQVRGPPGRLRYHRVTLQARDGHRLERVEFNATGAFERHLRSASLYTNATGATVGMARLANGRIVSYTGPVGPPDSVAGSALLESVIAAGEFRFDESDRGPFGASTVGTFRFDDVGIPIDLADPREASARITITTPGVVRGMYLTYVGEFRGEPVSVTVVHTISSVGATQVSTPAWARSRLNGTA